MRWLIIIAIVVLVALGLFVPRYLAPDNLANCTEPVANTMCAPADAIVAISGGDTLARAHEAVDLYKAGWADTLIFSGAASDKSGPSNADVMKADAIKLGVPAADILIDSNANTTNENAVNVIKLARAENADRLNLVTSAYHQRRASLEFTKAAESTIQIVSHPVERDSQWSDWWWLTPAGWWLSGSELVKIGAFYVGVS